MRCTLALRRLRLLFLLALPLAGFSGCRRTEAAARPGLAGDAGPDPGNWFRAVGEAGAYDAYRADVEGRGSWTWEDLVRRYPILYGEGPGYAAGEVEYAEPIGKALETWSSSGRKWRSDLFLDRVRRDGMAVAEAVRFPNYFQALDAIFHADLPLLFTTDALLQTVYLSYDRILIELEVGIYIPSLKQILDASLARARNDYGREAHAEDVRELLETAVYLLDPSRDLAKASPAVAGHIAAARALKTARVGLFGEDAEVDFTQFKPRGHYTRSPELGAFFQAMMWLSRADLAMRLGPSRPGADRARMKRASLVLWDCVERSGTYADWERMDRDLDFLVGLGDGMGLDGMRLVARALGIGGAREFLEDFDEARFDAALRSAGTGAQAVLSQAKDEDPEGTGHVEDGLEPIFSFMPQRFALDSYTFSQLVHEQVKDKLMPSPLELAFALGDNSALADLAPAPAPEYPGTLASQRDLYDALREETWQGSLYTGWLHALRQLNGAEANAAADPAFRTRAWRMKMRNTQLASWAQLRHNTILYVKQSYTTRILCDFPRVHVEPYPAFYQAMGAYASRGEELFLEGPTGGVSGYFRHLAEVSGRLLAVAERTARGQAPTDSQAAWLRQALSRKTSRIGCGGPPESFYTGWYMGLNYGYSRSLPAEKTDYTIADVHTKLQDDAGPAQVLHVATGPVQILAAAIRMPGCVSMFVGPVATYYEVRRTGSEPERLTDEEWTAALREQASWVERPAWAKAFLSP